MLDVLTQAIDYLYMSNPLQWPMGLRSHARATKVSFAWLYWRLKHVIRHIEGLASCLHHFAALELGLGLVFFCFSMAGAGNGIDVLPFLHVPV